MYKGCWTKKKTALALGKGLNIGTGVKGVGPLHEK